ncbi:MAG TPA: hypothetical protein VGC92_02420, partial [Phenylobacterium sp.]
MVALSDRKIEIVRTLVESAPDRIVGGLQRALAETSGDTVLASVRLLVEAEARDRMLRNAVFSPVAPLCVGDGSGAESLVFPARALALVWRGLKSQAPKEMAAAETAAQAVASAFAAHQRLPEVSKPFDQVVIVAAEALRTSEARDFRAAAEVCERARPGGAEAFAACLDISPVVRRAIPRLPDWVAQPAEEVAAAAHLAFKDAVEIAEDAGPRFFEMLAAQIDPPWMVLRIISAIMDKPTERYLHDSELGGFAERVMDNIDQGLKAIGGLDLDAGPAAGTAAALRVGLITEQTFELEVAIELTRDHGWGKRIFDQKRALASVVENRLKEAEKLAAAALPTGTSGLTRFRKAVPRLEEMPDAKAVTRALTALTFAQAARPFAGHGGFSAAHSKALEKIGAQLDHYIEEVLDMARGGEADLAIAHAHLRVAADAVGLVREEKAGE